MPVWRIQQKFLARISPFRQDPQYSRSINVPLRRALGLEGCFTVVKAPLIPKPKKQGSKPKLCTASLT
jgi:hypothetical protein